MPKITRAALLLLALIYPVAPVSAAKQTRIGDVVYGHKLGVALTMDVFKPARPIGIGVVWMLSSGWVSDYDDIEPWWAEYYTRRGLTFFAVMHGTQPRFTMPEIVQDIHRAVRFIRTNAARFGIDPNRLGAAGSSAGGHLAMMMAAYGGPGDPNAKDPVDRASSAVQAVACFHPPTDFINFGKPGVNVLDYKPFKELWHVFGVRAGATPQERYAVTKAMSPIYGLANHAPPIMIVQGDADFIVPLQQAQIAMEALARLKVPHKLVIRHKGTHTWPNIEKDNNLVADWLVKRLSRASAGGQLGR
jgi:acetyl esterase/lipase